MCEYFKKNPEPEILKKFNYFLCVENLATYATKNSTVTYPPMTILMEPEMFGVFKLGFQLFAISPALFIVRYLVYLVR